VNAVFHYVPLHSSPAGRKFGRTPGELPRTDNLSERLVRLPLWLGMGEDHIARVVNTLGDAVGGQ
jgi:dTDP-4-amino-4,6-dideoxygalactose transaminase